MAVNKCLDAAEAIGYIRSGMRLGIGGWSVRRKPMALVRELLRSDVTDLTLVSYGGCDVGMLCAAGKVKKLIFAFVSLDAIPLEPYFRLARQNATVEVMEVDEGMFRLGLKAAAMRVPYIPTALGLGTDVLTRNPELALVGSPYQEGEEWVAMPALELDVSLVHVDRADSRGLCQIKGPDHYMDDLFVRAAERTFVSCDELVETEYFHRDIEETRSVFWERSQTTGVVHSACGAHPTSCAPLYGVDAAHLRRYAASAKEEGGWSGYYEEFIAPGEARYLERVGGADAVAQLPLSVF